MAIHSLARALWCVSLLAPAVASASDGVIRFSGAIVEPAGCRVDTQGAGAGPAAPRVSCQAPAGRAAVPAGNVVTVSTKVLPAAPGQGGSAAREARIVTLDYL
ncbi:hypothetical protein [Achromobacter sp. UMC46]|uniref:hypothetical protein n=1 Tax=Achromobacter sp. UMC46 TaxID=1862319 RepID=UPI001602F8B0|nr:hypothetical protein [Achromobacter sp. UMC46]MBB1594035.1 hypothetical protein [Achromobacter sp. UMC46]